MGVQFTEVSTYRGFTVYARNVRRSDSLTLSCSLAEFSHFEAIFPNMLDRLILVVSSRIRISHLSNSSFRRWDAYDRFNYSFLSVNLTPFRLPMMKRSNMLRIRQWTRFDVWCLLLDHQRLFHVLRHMPPFYNNRIVKKHLFVVMFLTSWECVLDLSKLTDGYQSEAYGRRLITESCYPAMAGCLKLDSTITVRTRFFWAEHDFLLFLEAIWSEPFEPSHSQFLYCSAKNDRASSLLLLRKGCSKIISSPPLIQLTENTYRAVSENLNLLSDRRAIQKGLANYETRLLSSGLS